MRDLDALTEALAAEGLSAEVARHLVLSYGTEAKAIANLMAADRSLAGPLVLDGPWRIAEVVYQARREMALTVSDVLIRRTHAFHLRADQAVGAAPVVAQLLASELGWDADRRAASVGAYIADVERMRRAFRPRDPA